MRWILAAVVMMAAGLALGQATQPAATAPATGPASQCKKEDVCEQLDGQIDAMGTTTPSAIPAVAPAIMATLQSLHDVDNTLTSFSADAKKIDTSVRSGDAETRVGTVYYKKDAGKTSLAMQVDKLFPGEGVRVVAKDEIYAFVPPNYVHRDSANKVFERKEVVKPGVRIDPLKIGSGMMPLPIGQDPKEMIRDFVITQETPNDLPKGIIAADVTVLKLVPRDGTHYDFTAVTLTIDKKLNLPVVIDQVKTDGDTSKFVLTKMQVNSPTAAPAKAFDDTVPADKTWKIIEGDAVK